ncbi:hypothetical protein BpHYR1_040962 [Brachionus plicatilis]|uniref:Uncharacterized protein n=1 Tax=Brachionus plicatilis TaxID=10195 RepID=A0A3M7PWZ2_BRAPC|nr:hypothetical protein BpHYR1_040962 [Brachionus plicatilis]
MKFVALVVAFLNLASFSEHKPNDQLIVCMLAQKSIYCKQSLSSNLSCHSENDLSTFDISSLKYLAILPIDSDQQDVPLYPIYSKSKLNQSLNFNLTFLSQSVTSGTFKEGITIKDEECFAELVDMLRKTDDIRSTKAPNGKVDFVGKIYLAETGKDSINSKRWFYYPHFSGSFEWYDKK